MKCNKTQNVFNISEASAVSLVIAGFHGNQKINAANNLDKIILSITNKKGRRRKMENKKYFSQPIYFLNSAQK
jgi:hypothetical protein